MNCLHLWSGAPWESHYPGSNWEKRSALTSPGSPLPADGLGAHRWEGHVGEGHLCGGLEARP